jgi:hypothetical protein
LIQPSFQPGSLLAINVRVAAEVPNYSSATERALEFILFVRIQIQAINRQRLVRDVNGSVVRAQ